MCSDIHIRIHIITDDETFVVIVKVNCFLIRPKKILKICFTQSEHIVKN